MAYKAKTNKPTKAPTFKIYTDHPLPRSTRGSYVKTLQKMNVGNSIITENDSDYWNFYATARNYGYRTLAKRIGKENQREVWVVETPETRITQKKMALVKREVEMEND